MVNLAAMLLHGEGIEADQREAAGWFFVAAQSGDPRAQYALGVMAARGMGMNVNREAALDLFRLSAAQGLRDAQLRLVEAGLPLVEQDDPTLPPYNLPPSLEPLPGVSLAADLAPPLASGDSGEPPLRLTPTDDGDLTR